MEISCSLIRLRVRGWKWAHNHTDKGASDEKSNEECEEEETIIPVLLNVGCVVTEDLEEKRMAETLRYTTSRIYLYTIDGSQRVMENPSASKNSRKSKESGCTCRCCTSNTLNAHFSRKADAKALLRKVQSSASSTT